jgi:hypothetical protein
MDMPKMTDEQRLAFIRWFAGAAAPLPPGMGETKHTELVTPAAPPKNVNIETGESWNVQLDWTHSDIVRMLAIKYSISQRDVIDRCIAHAYHHVQAGGSI